MRTKYQCIDCARSGMIFHEKNKQSINFQPNLPENPKFSPKLMLTQQIFDNCQFHFTIIDPIDSRDSKKKMRANRGQVTH